MQFPRKEIWIPVVSSISAFIVGLGAGYGISRFTGTRSRVPVEDVGTEKEDGGNGREVSGRADQGAEAKDGSQPELPFEPKSVQVSAPERPVKHITPHVVDELEPIEDAPTITLYHTFTDMKDDWDWDRENELREGEDVFIITIEEYQNEESGYDQDSLTYYEGDNVLSDSMDKPIADHERYFCELKFGHGSKDPLVVFVRNDKTQMEWEIIKHEGRYEIEVLGAELEHSYEKKKQGKKHPKFKLE